LRRRSDRKKEVRTTTTLARTVRTEGHRCLSACGLRDSRTGRKSVAGDCRRFVAIHRPQDRTSPPSFSPPSHRLISSAPLSVCWRRMFVKTRPQSSSCVASIGCIRLILAYGTGCRTGLMAAAPLIAACRFVQFELESLILLLHT